MALPSARSRKATRIASIASGMDKSRMASSSVITIGIAPMLSLGLERLQNFLGLIRDRFWRCEHLAHDGFELLAGARFKRKATLLRECNQIGIDERRGERTAQRRSASGWHIRRSDQRAADRGTGREQVEHHPRILAVAEFADGRHVRDIRMPRQRTLIDDPDGAVLEPRGVP